MTPFNCMAYITLRGNRAFEDKLHTFQDFKIIFFEKEGFTSYR